ncbi:MAG: MBL fold metallo-hydrolase [Winogradskyella sp.]|uniref:MBL fold metallo-hydrolase n=1 Tax=Winogradskyella sp. TaxID=1883156 RepID=UPI0017ADF6DD|nr:MBL fold metallo-hydrolase [Winogradskyella sp.]MBT8245182.1 MBL fold metallo-hydrolase [Winogradskyella sp.]NNK22631.1 MBL fold metallo-hydrolase [Winogradskyella sp.]
MRLIKTALFLCFLIVLYSCKSDKKTKNLGHEKAIEIVPVNHGTLVIKSENYNFYVDPVGGADKFSNYENADFVLITDIHGDHLNIETLQALNLSNTTVIAPKAVVNKLPKNIAKTVVTLNNNDTFGDDNLKIEAIPMYNLREEALNFHTKGRGNGYVINLNNQRIYISGDTEDIPEMRNLKNIDIAFVCMNLPYTMTVESAASAVLDFKPKKVYPYHYRGKGMMGDVYAFKNKVNTKNPDIDVVLLNWYN